MRHKNTLQTALAKIFARKGVNSAEDLLLHSKTAYQKPRYARVNTLKVDVESAIIELVKDYKVTIDSTVSELLVLPVGTDLHDHHLVHNGDIFLQGKASSMVAIALSPEPGWKVLDACAAPGNKTSHLAALMGGKGNIIAFEKHSNRVRLLEDTIRRSGAPNVEIFHGDFLDINAQGPLFSDVRAILLDPSCSGSGIAAERLDHLLPSHTEDGVADSGGSLRVKKLAAFQKKALVHALCFPAVERVVYSTCSIHREENEDVVESVLPLASTLDFELVAPFPEWPHRGLPTFNGSELLLRTCPEDDMEGFFIALFVRKNNRILRREDDGPTAAPPGVVGKTKPRGSLKKKKKKTTRAKRAILPLFFSRVSRSCFYRREEILRQASVKKV